MSNLCTAGPGPKYGTRQRREPQCRPTMHTGNESWLTRRARLTRLLSAVLSSCLVCLPSRSSQAVSFGSDHSLFSRVVVRRSWQRV